MAKIEKTKIVVPVEKKRIYTDDELKAFDVELETKYRYTVTLSDGKTCNLLDFKRLHRDYGTTVANTPPYADSVVMALDGVGEPITPTRYERLEEKIAQWGKWRGRMEYGKKMAAKQFDKMATATVAEKMLVPDVNELSDKYDDLKF